MLHCVAVCFSLSPHLGADELLIYSPQMNKHQISIIILLQRSWLLDCSVFIHNVTLVLRGCWIFTVHHKILC